MQQYVNRLFGQQAGGNTSQRFWATQGLQPTIWRRLARTPLYGFADVKSHAASGRGDAWITLLLWRPVSFYVTWLLVNLRVRSVAVASANIVIIAGAGVLLFHGASWALIAAGLAIQIYAILDNVDGELARFEMRRLNRPNSRVGHYLDLFAHKVSAICLFATGYAVAAETGDPVYLLFGFLLSFCVLGPALEPAKDIILNAEPTEDRKIAAAKIGAFTVGRSAHTGIGRLKRLVLAANEFFGFPGWLLLVCVAAVLDGLLPHLQIAGLATSYRGILLIVLTPIYIVKFLFAFQWYVRVMLAIKHD